MLRLMALAAERSARRTGKDPSITRDMVDDVYGRHLAYTNRSARLELGAHFRPAAEVLRDALRWLLFVDALKPSVALKVRSALGPRAAPDADWLATPEGRRRAPTESGHHAAV